MFRDGRSATIRHVRPGETFGESVLFNETYPSSTETLEPSRLYGFDTGEFRRLVLAEPELALLILAAMAQLLIMLNQWVEELLLPVPARLARYLLALCSEQGNPSLRHLPVAKRELAARLGTVPETLSRTLNRFVGGGLIAVRGDVLSVLNRPALERLAQQLAVAAPRRHPVPSRLTQVKGATPPLRVPLACKYALSGLSRDGAAGSPGSWERSRRGARRDNRPGAMLATTHWRDYQADTHADRPSAR